MHPHIHRTPQSRPPLPGLTSAARGYWQSIGNAGVACQILGWALCRFTAGEQGSIYGLLFSILGICAFLAELYGRLRYRKKQLSFPRGSLCAAILAFVCWMERLPCNTDRWTNGRQFCCWAEDCSLCGCHSALKSASAGGCASSGKWKKLK